MSETCICQTQKTLLFACAGGCNVGQLSNRAGVELTKSGKGKLFCLAGIGGNIDAIIESTKCGEKLIAIDGCRVGCAKSSLEEKGFTLTSHNIVTDMGIQKTLDLGFSEEELNTVITAVESNFSRF